METNFEKVDLGGLSTNQAIKLVEGYMAPGGLRLTGIKAPISYASIPPGKHIPEPLPDPIEPKGWWESCWLNPKRKEDVYDLPSIRQYDTIG